MPRRAGSFRRCRLRGNAWSLSDCTIEPAPPIMAARKENPVTGPSEALHLMVPVQALLPFAGENLPFGSIVTTDLFYDVREQHGLRPVPLSADSRNLSAS